MALMYPPTPKEYEASSLEGVMFDALKNLNDEYMVFHSMTITTLRDEIIKQSETDFVIFHPKKGILCIEAKAGQVNYSEGKWKYGNGKPMSGNGPFNQASNNMFNLIEYFKVKKSGNLLKRCNFLYAVWFPSVSEADIRRISLPSESPIDIIITKDDFNNIEEKISEIFKYSFMSNRETNLSKNDMDIIVNNILAPSFDLVSLVDVIGNHKKIVFKKMLKEQVSLLNYLEEQRTAVINGLGGTGKTVMALEKAKKHALNGEKVLFLCYNSKLKEYLKDNYSVNNLSYYTIDGFACFLCNTSEADFDLLRNMLETMYCENSFPFQHVIIDEGQDFGRDNIEECEIIELLKDNVIDNEVMNGSFYIFYDKNQMIQSRSIPKYIADADCKLTLYRNCRNTRHIATTSLRFLNMDKKPLLFDAAIEGNLPKMIVCDKKNDQIEKINKLIDYYLGEGYENITILTCKTEDTSCLLGEVAKNIYFYKAHKFLFTTCRKFKGLESDVVILIDVDYQNIIMDVDKNMYVGSSRAKYELGIIAYLTEDECEEITKEKGLAVRRNFQKAIATCFNSKLVKE